MQTFDFATKVIFGSSLFRHCFFGLSFLGLQQVETRKLFLAQSLLGFEALSTEACFEWEAA